MSHGTTCWSKPELSCRGEGQKEFILLIFIPDFQGYSDRDLLRVLAVISDFYLEWPLLNICLWLSGIKYLFDSWTVRKPWSCVQRILISSYYCFGDWVFFTWFLLVLGLFLLFFPCRNVCAFVSSAKHFIIGWNVKIPNPEGRCFYSQVL